MRHQPLGSGWLTIIHRICSLLDPVSGDLGITMLWEVDKQLDEKDGEENWQEDLAPCPQPAHGSCSLGSTGSRPVRPRWAPGTKLDRQTPLQALGTGIIRRTWELLKFRLECRTLEMQSRFALGSGCLVPGPPGTVRPVGLIDTGYAMVFGKRPGF